MIRGNRPRLTREDLGIMTCIVSGMKPAQAMVELGISRNVYSRRRERLMARMGALNDGQIGALCERYQLLGILTQNIIEDGREVRLDARRLGAQ